MTEKTQYTSCFSKRELESAIMATHLDMWFSRYWDIPKLKCSQNLNLEDQKLLELNTSKFIVQRSIFVKNWGSVIIDLDE